MHPDMDINASADDKPQQVHRFRRRTAPNRRPELHVTYADGRHLNLPDRLLNQLSTAKTYGYEPNGAFSVR